MNLTCPVCGEIALSVPRKLWSSPVFPAHCGRCGSLIVAKRTFGNTFVQNVIAHVLVFGAALVSLLMWSWWPLIAALVLDCTIVAVLFHWRTPLLAITRDQVSRARRTALYAAGGFLLLVVIAGLTDR